MPFELHQGDCLSVLPTLPAESVHCVITSPPYWGLRDYGVEGQLGQEPTLDAYIANLVAVFREVRRVLRADGTLWLNLGDCYASNWPCQRRNQIGAGSLPDGRRKARPPRLGLGLKDKDLVGMPWRVAFALQADGWYLRTEIIWEKPNCLPESVKDRPTRSHETIFLLTRKAKYFYDADTIREPHQDGSLKRYQYKLNSIYADADAYGGTQSHNMAASEKLGDHMHPGGRNRRTVWRIPTKPFRGAHFAVFPPKLVEPCLLAGTSAHGVCPHCGAPWVRIISKGQTAHDGETQTEYATGSTANRLAKLRQAARARGEEYQDTRTTIGWQPSCTCSKHTPIPATVLDPFAGSGTTGLVALAYGRQFVGIELNPEYLTLARTRLSQCPTTLPLY